MLPRREFFKKSTTAIIAGFLSAKDGSAYTKLLASKNPVTLEKAWELHKKLLIIDGHNDTVVEHDARNSQKPLTWMEKDLSYQTDIPRARENGQPYVAFMIVSAGSESPAECLRIINEVDKSIEQNPKELKKVMTSADVIAAAASGKVGIIYSIEGSFGPLGGNIDNVKALYDRGVRLAGITHGEGGTLPGYLQGTWSRNNPFTKGARAERLKTDVGLTPFGLEALKAMNQLGILVDLSHSNDRTFFDVLEKSASVPITSHTAVYSICQHGRCVTDDQIKAIAAKGGVMGMTFVPDFIGGATLDKFVDHICYIVDLVGIDYVGIGSDYDGGIENPTIPDVSKLALLTQGLLNRGFSEEEIRKIWGGNFLRIIKKVVDKS